jgi:hypothetical protein
VYHEVSCGSATALVAKPTERRRGRSFLVIGETPGLIGGGEIVCEMQVCC